MAEVEAERSEGDQRAQRLRQELRRLEQDKGGGSGSWDVADLSNQGKGARVLTHIYVMGLEKSGEKRSGTANLLIHAMKCMASLTLAGNPSSQSRCGFPKAVPPSTRRTVYSF